MLNIASSKSGKVRFMAQVLGESGRFVSQEALRKRQHILVLGLVTMAFLGAVAGFVWGLRVHQLNPPVWMLFLIPGVAILAIIGIGKWTLAKADALGKEQLNWQRGADGENSVAQELEKFPDEFKVIHDLTTPNGNIDHVVIGSTGVFVLDTKNWQGVVSADGKGELLLNGKPPDKPEVRYFTRRIMDVKDKVKALTEGLDPYFQAVFVFTSARVDANWGTTKSVHCIRDEQLYDYIVESKRVQKLSKSDVEKWTPQFGQ
jgi:hypothetical protein